MATMDVTNSEFHRVSVEVSFAWQSLCVALFFAFRTLFDAIVRVTLYRKEEAGNNIFERGLKTTITSLPDCSRLETNALQIRFNLPKKYRGRRTLLMWFWLRGWKRRRPQSGQWWASVCSCLISYPYQLEAPKAFKATYISDTLYREGHWDGAQLDDMIRYYFASGVATLRSTLPRNSLCIYDIS